MVSSARCRARKQGIECDLSVDDLVMPERCPLLGIPLRVGGEDHAPTIDRLDPSRGYVKGNAWVISRRANQIKSNATLQELAEVVRQWAQMILPK